MDPSLTDTSARANRSSYLYRLLDAAIVIICGLAVTEFKFSDEAMADPPQIHLFPVSYTHLDVYKRQARSSATEPATLLS